MTAKRKKCGMQSKVTFMDSLCLHVFPHIYDVLSTKILILLIKYWSPQLQKTICLKL